MARPQTQVRRVREPDGIYEEEIGVVARRKLSNASVAVENVLAVLRDKREAIYRRPGTHDTDEINSELAAAIVEGLIAANLLTP